MADDHAEPRAEFPISMLVGALVITCVVLIVLSVFVFGSGGHGPATAAPKPASTSAPH